MTPNSRDSNPLLLVASNRGPVTFQEDHSGQIQAQRGAGGLVTALTGVLMGTAGRWVATAMTAGDRSMAHRYTDGLRTDIYGQSLNLRYLTIDPGSYDRYYNGFSNSILWFMNHNMWNLPYTPSFDDTTAVAWTAYQQVNRTFAEALAEEIDELGSPPVMLQDYHLTLTARYLKDLKPEVFSYHFTHTPWAQPATMAVLPGKTAAQILQGMLANDLLGFHCSDWADNFLWSCRRMLGAEVDFERRSVDYDGSRTVVRAYPIQIDTGAVRAAAHSESSPEYLAWLEELLQGRQLVLRIDRFELSKNVVRGFAGFAQMLRDHPEMAGRVVHLALLHPSREALSEYQEYQHRAEALARQINHELGTADWQPIVLVNEPNYIKAITCCRRYDVLLVNPISDGMNLVAKEGPTVNEVDGAVVLSRNAGAWEELQNGVLTVNPYDVQQLADAIYEGLTMDGERRARMAESNRRLLAAATLERWAQRQLRDIDLLRDGG